MVGGRPLNKVLDVIGMRRARFVIAAFAIASAFIGWRYYRFVALEHAFAATSIGDSEREVIARLGSTDRIDTGRRFWVRYASEPCRNCSRRLWWENPLIPGGFEAWSIDIGPDNRVVDTAHWVSP